MKLFGLQKMTLLDFPGHVACTVFLGGCDFRCPFCHNYELAELSVPAVMEEEEFFAFLEKRRSLLDGVAVTGGEPCLYQELPRFLSRIRGMGFMTKLDTNGYHPGILSRILTDGLADYVAMDIKNSPDKYAVTAGIDQIDLSRILESIQMIFSSGTDYEFRTTVVKEFHDEQDFAGIAQMIPGAKRYFLQPFTDRDSVPFGNLHAPDPTDLELFAKVLRLYLPGTDVQIRGMDQPASS